LILISFAADVIPTHIPASAIKREKLQAERLPVNVECIYTGITNYPPWLKGRDAPWTPNVRIEDVYDDNDQLTSMAIDALGRIYVCYETKYTPAGGGRYGWGIATSVDDGQTWDNRVYYSDNNSVRYPEIAISNDGKIWIWGTFASGSDDVIWLKSVDGGFNDPDNVEGFFWFGAGNADNRTYPEVVTWGDNTQLILSTWTYDNGTETVVSYIYTTDGGAGGWWIVSLNSDGNPDGMTSIGANYDGTNYIAVHGWEQQEGTDWNVLCMIDTLETGAGLSGWGTGNPAADRYPSVFASQGYAYIAYQADVGGGDNDIMFNYSTDYGVTWPGSMIDLTNDPANEPYPRLYGDAATIGVDYIYAANSVRFNYSLDNGQEGTWLTTPETVTDNNSANNNYHSASLLYTSSYWHAAWEDTRDADNEIYTSKRLIGQGNITHRPAELIFDYNSILLSGFSTEKYIIRHSANTIDTKLSEVIAKSTPDEFIPIFVMLTKQLNPEYLIARVERMSKSERRQFVINECKALASESQKEMISFLKAKETEGKVSNIVSLWSTNTICLKARSEIINELTERDDVWEIGYSAPLQIIGVDSSKEPGYKKIEFIPDDGREICWGVAKINADDIWALGYTGAGVVVGHMDSGVNYNHNDLADHMWDGGPSYPNHGWDFSYNDPDPMDDVGHGTETAGIVAGDGTSGSSTGVAPDAQIMALKIYPGTNTEMGQAIQFALDNGADLLSCSIGWPNPSDAIKDWCRGQSNTVYAAGLVWCNAAGNGDGAGGHYAVPHDINSPADCPGPYYAPNGGNGASIAVGATTTLDMVPTWSSYGPTEWNTGTYTDYPYPPGLTKPDVAAPGEACKSLDYLDISGYKTNISGTSFAQPHHAGTVALMLSRNPALTPGQIDSLIQTTAKDIHTAGRDNYSGAGRIDALLAVNAISEGARWAQLWIINQATATGILQVSDITKAQNQGWIISVSPTQFSVSINDSQEVMVSVDTTGQGLSPNTTYYDTLLVWSNSTDANPERVPVILATAGVGIEEREAITSKQNSRLLSVLPNPFRNSVRIDYVVPYTKNINLTIYDVCGKKVRTLIDKVHNQGDFSIIWDARDDYDKQVSAGIYFCRIKAEGNVLTNKLILLK